MNQPLFIRHSISIAVVTLLQVIVPPLIVSGSLYLTSLLYGIDFDQYFEFLSIIAAALAVIMLRSSASVTENIQVGQVPLAVSVVMRWLLLLSVLLIIGYVTKYSAHFSRRAVLTWMLVTPALLTAGALFLRAIMRMILMDPANARRVVFAGCNEASLSLADRLNQNSELCMKVVGFFDDRSTARLGARTEIELIGKLPDLPTFVRDHHIDVIFISLPIRHLRRVMDLMDDLHNSTASIYYVPDINVFDLIQARTGEIMGMPVVSLCETPFFGVRGAIKRLSDVILSILILIPAAPAMLFIALLVKLSAPGPVIFKQRRYGLDGRQIMVYKFRSMRVTEDGEHIAQATKDDSRITPIGRILRRYSLDELPQLINVLQGRMSLVGPRPHAVSHNEEYRKLIKGYMWRHKVLPGITGLAQVNGCRGETARLEDMQARVNYDLDYLRHWTPVLDLKILVLTALRLFRDDRAY